MHFRRRPNAGCQTPPATPSRDQIGDEALCARRRGFDAPTISIVPGDRERRCPARRSEQRADFGDVEPHVGISAFADDLRRGRASRPAPPGRSGRAAAAYVLRANERAMPGLDAGKARVPAGGCSRRRRLTMRRRQHVARTHHQVVEISSRACGTVPAPHRRRARAGWRRPWFEGPQYRARPLPWPCRGWPGRMAQGDLAVADASESTSRDVDRVASPAGIC
jgi:hypothetical protein